MKKGFLFDRGCSNQGFQIDDGEELDGYSREERDELEAGEEVIGRLEGHQQVNKFYDQIQTSLEKMRR